MIITFRSRPMAVQALFVAAASSGALLAGAHLFENVGGLAPCALCLDQREAHWTALAIALFGAFVGVTMNWRRAAAAAAGACAMVYLVSAGLAFYHAGVENHFWPGPATCSGGGVIELGDASLADILNEKPDMPSCSDAAWRLFGVSMAGYNLLASAALFGLCLMAAAMALRDSRKSSRQEKRP